VVFNVNYANDNYQSNQKLAKFKQRIDELETDNKRLKNEMEQQVLSKTFLQQSHDKEVAKQAKTIKAHVSETRQLKLKINNLQAEINDLQKYKVASKKAVSDLKTKRRLEMEAEFKLLVSYCIKSRYSVRGRAFQQYDRRESDKSLLEA
jgi:predicted RNase H-like nuclease (RuvC/YqgF family)